MQDTMKINDDVTVGAQPTEDELRRLDEQGYKSVINFRTEGEDDQPLSPDAEGKQVKAQGLDYLHVPVAMGSMENELVDRFRQQYVALPKPVFAHCKSGKRAGAMVMMHLAAEQGMSGEQTLQQAEQMGFECEQEDLRQFVKNYVDNHSN